MRQAASFEGEGGGTTKSKALWFLSIVLTYRGFCNQSHAPPCAAAGAWERLASIVFGLYLFDQALPVESFVCLTLVDHHIVLLSLFSAKCEEYLARVMEENKNLSIRRYFICLK